MILYFFIYYGRREFVGAKSLFLIFKSRDPAERQELLERVFSQGNYYIGLGLFYISLYGISWGITQLYPGQSDLLTLFSIFLFFVTAIIYIAFYSLYFRRIENVFFVFRIHVLISGVIQVGLLVWVLILAPAVSIFMVINSILFLVGLATLMFLDPFIRTTPKVTAYTLFYVLALLFSLRTDQAINPGRGDNLIFLWLVCLLGFVLYFVIPLLIRFSVQKDPTRGYTHMNKRMGAALIFVAGVLGLTSLYLSPDRVWRLLVLLLPILIFCIWVHRSYRNYLALGLATLSIMGVYFFFFRESLSSLEALLFVVALLFPVAMTVGASSLYLGPPASRIDLYVTHYISLGFMVGFTVWGLFQASFSYQSIFVFFLLFLESLIWYGSYLQARRIFPEVRAQEEK